MLYLQHGKSKGWDDSSADTKNSKSLSFTPGFCYQKNSEYRRPSKTRHWASTEGFWDYFFYLLNSSSLFGHENSDCISLWQSVPIWKDKLNECTAPPPFFIGHLSLHIKTHMSGGLDVCAFWQLKPTKEAIQSHISKANVSHLAFWF